MNTTAIRESYVELKNELAKLETLDNPPADIVARLQGLMAVLGAQEMLREFERSALYEKKRTTPPEGFELTSSRGLYGFRRKGTETTIRWADTLPKALRQAWDHAENILPEVESLVVATREHELEHATVRIQHAMLQAVLFVSHHRDAIHPRAIVWEILEHIGLPEDSGVAVIDHLVELDYLEEVVRDGEKPQPGSASPDRVFTLGTRAERSRGQSDEAED